MPRKRKQQGAKVPTGLPYGDGQALAEAQRAIPLPGPGSTPQPQRGTPAAGGAGGSAPPPAAVDPMALAIQAAQQVPPPEGGFAGPSTRPEPVTTGLPVGPGAGLEALPLPAFTAEDDALLDLVNAYRMAPSPGLARLIEVARNRAMASARQRDAGRAARRPRY